MFRMYKHVLHDAVIAALVEIEWVYFRSTAYMLLYTYPFVYLSVRTFVCLFDYLNDSFIVSPLMTFSSFRRNPVYEQVLRLHYGLTDDNDDADEGTEELDCAVLEELGQM